MTIPCPRCGRPLDFDVKVFHVGRYRSTIAEVRLVSNTIQHQCEDSE